MKNYFTKPRRNPLTYTAAKKEENLFCQYFSHVHTYAQQLEAAHRLSEFTGLSIQYIERKLAYLARVPALGLTYHYKPSNVGGSCVESTKAMEVYELSRVVPGLPPSALDAIYKVLSMQDIQNITRAVRVELENN